MRTGRHLRTPSRQRVAVACMALLALATLVGAGMAGPVAVPLHEVPGALAALLRGGEGGMAATLLDLRLGRAATAFAVGAALSLSGVMMQSLLRHPRADPYVLGL